MLKSIEQKKIPEKIPDFASEFSMNGVSRGPMNKKFNGGVRAKAMWKLKIKNGRKTRKSDAGG